MSIHKSLGIVAATRAIVFLVSLASVVIVSRLLTPAEIGLFSVSVALVGIAHVFRDFGVSQYLIQLREVTEDRKRAAFSVTLAVSWLIALSIYLVRDQAAAFYGNTGVARILSFTAINFLLLPIGAPLKSLMQRDMQFGKLAVVSLSHHCVQAIATIVAAMSGASYMSLAWGSVAGTLTNVAVMIMMSPSGALQRPTLRGWKEVFRFGSRASGASLATELGAGAPDMIFGRTLGFEAVGFYSRATGLISSLLGQLIYVVSSVYVPAFAKGYRSGDDIALYYAKAATMLTGVTAPAIAILGLLSPNLIALMFGPQWGPSASLAQYLCAYSLITAPFAIAAASLIATGSVTALLRCNVIVEISRAALLLSSIYLSLEHVVISLGLIYLLQAILFMRALRSTISLSFITLWRHTRVSYALVPFAVIPGWLVLLAMRTADFPQIWLVAVAGAAAGAGWILGLRTLHHPLHEDVVKLASQLIDRLRARSS